MSEEQIDTLVAEVRELPISLSETLQSVIDACDDPDTSVNDLTANISDDQSLVAMLLKLANSAYYGYSRKIETLPEAIVLLGYSTIKSLAITSTTMNLLFQRQDELSDVRERIWKHSLGVGMTARALARKRGNIHPEKAFVAGILHDLGLIIQSCYRIDRFSQALEQANSEGVIYEAVEQDIFGYTQASLGAHIAEEWSFPVTHCEAIELQMSPDEATLQPALAAVTHLANWLVESVGYGILDNGALPEVSPGALEMFQIDDVQLEPLQKSVKKLLDEYATSMDGDGLSEVA